MCSKMYFSCCSMSQTLSCSFGHNYPNSFSARLQQNRAFLYDLMADNMFLVFGYMNEGFGVLIVHFCPDSINHSKEKSLVHKIFNAMSFVY